MPSDDLVLNVRQITQYPAETTVSPTDAVLLQSGGIGGPYYYAAAQDLVATALAGSLRMLDVGGSIEASSFSAGPIGYLFNLTWDGSNFRYATANYGGQIFLDPSPWPSGPMSFGFAFAPPGAAGSIAANWQRAMFVGVDGGMGLPLGTLTVARDPAAPFEVATQNYVDGQIQHLMATTVRTFNGRTGDVFLQTTDIVWAGGAPLWSPALAGNPTAPTPATFDNSMAIATTEFVQETVTNALANFSSSQSLVTSFNGRTGAVVLEPSDLTGAGVAPLQSPAFTGIPTAPSPPTNDNSYAIATTSWVVNEVGSILGAGFAPINSPAFTGIPTAPTANPGTSTGQLATTSFVQHAVTASTTGVASFNTRTGAVTLQGSDVAGAGGALTVSPAFTGNPTAPTAVAGTTTTQLATCQFVMTAIGSGFVTTFNGRSGAVTLTAADITGAGGAPLTSPNLTGVPLAPTAAPATNTQQIATTAFVTAAIAAVGGVTSFNSRAGAVTLQANDVSAVGGALTASPAFSGTPTAPTASPGNSTTQLATTAFVAAALAGSGVSSFNSRTGAVILTGADISSAGGALLAGPAFSGAPSAPTATAGTATTQLATCQFVAAAVAASVTSFNSRTGAITLTTADITGAGGAPIASPSFSGVPLGPTATAGTNSQQLATTAFVAAALSAAAVVTSFNSRTGAVILLAADVSAVGGALVASPSFTGVPLAPTATAGTNTAQIATTQFVANALSTAGGVTSFNSRAGVVTLTSADVNATAVGGPYTPQTWAAGGMVNKFRNPGMDINQRGTPITLNTGNQYTLDGWMVNGQAGTTIQQPYVTVGPSRCALQINGIAGQNSLYLAQRIESFVAAPLGGQQVTVQFRIYNNSGASITPQINVSVPTTADTAPYATNVLAPTNMQPCPNAAWTTVAYCFPLTQAQANLGIMVLLVPGNPTSGYVQITAADIRATPGVATGLVASPPPPEMRPWAAEFPFCQKYLWVSAVGQTNNNYACGFGESATTFLAMLAFPVRLRALPTVTFTAPSTFQCRIPGSAGATVTAISLANSGYDTIQINGSIASGSGLTTGYGLFLRDAAGASQIIASSEL